MTDQERQESEQNFARLILLAGAVTMIIFGAREIFG